MKKIFLILGLAMSPALATAQISATKSATGEVKTAQPKIMVIPYVKEGKDIRSVMDEDFNTRIAVAKIKEAFDTRGFTTIDFTQRLKSSKENSAFSSDNQNDFKTALIENSGADMYVQTELNLDKSANGTNATLILTAYEAATGNSLSNKVYDSGRYMTDDIGKLVVKAFEGTQEEFMNVLLERFGEIIEHGRSIIVEFNFAPDSQFNLDSEVNGKYLSDAIEAWIDENSFKNNYSLQGTTDTKIIYNDVRIPVLDQATGKNYNPNKFASEIVRWLKSMGVETSRAVKGQSLFITIK